MPIEIIDGGCCCGSSSSSSSSSSEGGSSEASSSQGSSSLTCSDCICSAIPQSMSASFSGFIYSYGFACDQDDGDQCQCGPGSDPSPVCEVDCFTNGSVDLVLTDCTGGGVGFGQAHYAGTTSKTCPMGSGCDTVDCTCEFVATATLNFNCFPSFPSGENVFEASLSFNVTVNFPDCEGSCTPIDWSLSASSGVKHGPPCDAGLSGVYPMTSTAGGGFGTYACSNGQCCTYCIQMDGVLTV